MSSQLEYQQQLDRGIRLPKIGATFFVAHERSQLLKPHLFRQIGELLPAAVIDDTVMCVNVSHISSNGLVYFQMDRSCCDYIQALIKSTICNKQVAECSVHRLRYPKSVVLAYDSYRGIHVRAKIIGHHVTGAMEHAYKCFYIDYGKVRLTAATQIYTIDETSFLNYYPSQAVPAKLDLLADVDAVTVERLRGIFHTNGAVQIEPVNQNEHAPNVTIYRQSAESRLNINRLVYMEIQLRQ